MGQKKSVVSVREMLPLLNDELRILHYGPFDIILVFSGLSLQAHKHVLISHSGYFNSLLKRFWNENKYSTSYSSIEMKDYFEPELFVKILNYFYTKKIDVNNSNVQELLETSTYLQIESLRFNCVQFIKERIDKRNCLPLYLYVSVVGPYELQTSLEDYLLLHFETIVSKSKDFLNLSPHTLERLICSDKLLVSSEGFVYKAVIRWINFDSKNRNSYLPSLLEHVHFPLMSLDEVESSVKKNPNLAKNVQEAKNYLSKNTKEKIAHWSMNQKPVRWPKIFVTIRMYWKNLPMEYFDFKSKTWSVLCPVQNWRSCTALVALASNIYFLGGEESDSNSPTGSRTVNRVTRYDCEKQKWSSSPSMCLARRWAASTVIGNIIYVIGGIGGRGGTYEKRLDSIECLDLSVKAPKWKILSSMSTPRSSHTVEVMNDSIYVVGGGDGKDWLCSAETYNPKTNKWSFIAPLRSKRWKCGLVVLHGYLYALGGMDSQKAGFWGSPLKTVERYSEKDNIWTSVAPMNEARFGCAVVAHQGRIYVSGGFGNKKAILNSSESYDPETNRWTKLTHMKSMSGFVGGVIVDRPIHFDNGRVEL